MFGLFFLDKATWIQLPLALVYSNSFTETELCVEAHPSLKLKNGSGFVVISFLFFIDSLYGKY